MTKIVARQVLTNREACERAFDFEIDYRGIVDGMEFLADAAIRGQDDFVKLPTWLAAGAVLALKGVVKRPPHRPRKDWREKRRALLLRLQNGRRGDDPMIVWTRERVQEIRRDAKASREPIKADDARLAAATEARVKFGSSLSEAEIAARSRRPGRYAPSKIIQPR